MLQAKLHSQEEDFRLQNSTLMAEFSKVLVPWIIEGGARGRDYMGYGWRAAEGGWTEAGLDSLSMVLKHGLELCWGAVV